MWKQHKYTKKRMMETIQEVTVCTLWVIPLQNFPTQESNKKERRRRKERISRSVFKNITMGFLGLTNLYLLPLPEMRFRSFVSTFGNLSVHVSRQACNLYRQSIGSTNKYWKNSTFRRPIRGTECFQLHQPASGNRRGGAWSHTTLASILLSYCTSTGVEPRTLCSVHGRPRYIHWATHASLKSALCELNNNITGRDHGQNSTCGVATIAIIPVVDPEGAQ